jgi:hypothetical protein
MSTTSERLERAVGLDGLAAGAGEPIPGGSSEPDLRETLVAGSTVVRRSGRSRQAEEPLLPDAPDGGGQAADTVRGSREIGQRPGTAYGRRSTYPTRPRHPVWPVAQIGDRFGRCGVTQRACVAEGICLKAPVSARVLLTPNLSWP